jgi:hypothetical protein
MAFSRSARMRARAARKAQADKFPMNLRGECGLFEDFSNLFASW